MSEQRAKRCLVCLDALFDTRLGTLNIIDPQVVINLNPDEFARRERDDFTGYGIDTELYNEAYRRRDKLTLKNSILTSIIPLIQQTIRQYTDSINPLRNGPIELELNMYPYRLSDDERLVFANLLEHKLGGLVRVTTVILPWKVMTLGYLAEHYHTVFIYDWLEWATVIEQSFRTEFAPSVTVVAPALLAGPTVDETTLDPRERAALKVASPTVWMEIIMSTLVGLTLEPVAYFTFIQ